jgi:hypothetical protein
LYYLAAYGLTHSVGRKEKIMYTQDLNNAMLYETERRRDEMAQARECCRVHQLLGEQPKKRSLVPVLVVNLVALALAFFHKAARF